MSVGSRSSAVVDERAEPVGWRARPCVQQRLLPERLELHGSEVGRQAIDLAHRALQARFQAVSLQPDCEGGETFAIDAVVNVVRYQSFDMIGPIHFQDSAL